METEDDFYKREEDRKWRERIEERLLSLTTDATVSQDRLDELEQTQERLDRLLRGDSDQDTEGIIEHVHELQTSINRLNTLMAPDALGHGGIIPRLTALERSQKGHEQSVEYHWKFWTAVVVAAITTMGFLIQQWGPKIKAILEKKSNDPLQQMIERAKKPKPRHRHIKVVPPPPESEESE